MVPISSIFYCGARTSCGAAGGIDLIVSLCDGVFRDFGGLSEFFLIRIGIGY